MKKLFLVILFVSSINAKNQSTQNLHSYIMANYFQFGNDLKNAGHWYLQIVPDNHAQYVYLGYVPYLSASKSFAEIVDLIPQLDQSFKGHQELQMHFANALEMTGKKDDAFARLVELNDKNKSHQELAFKVVQLYIERQEPENALKVIDNLLNNSARKPNNYIFLFLKSQIYVQLNKKDLALAAIQECIHAYPKFDKSWLLYAVLQEHQGKLEEAIKGYSTYLEITPDLNSEIQRHLATLQFRQKLVKQHSSADPKATLNTAAQLFEKQEYAKALHEVNHYLSLHTDDTEAKLLKLQILAQQKQFDSALSSIQEWASNQAEIELWVKALHLLTYIGLDYDKALKSLDVLAHKHPHAEIIAIYQVDLVLRHPHHKDIAIKVIDRALKLVSNTTIKTKLVFQKALVEYEMQHWQHAQKTIENNLGWVIDYPPLHNLLAYIYASKTNELDKANMYIAKALAQDADNPHFLDTKAVILYHQKNYADAITILEKVALAHPQDFTVQCHLGKCYQKQGNATVANQLFQKATALAKNDYERSKIKALLANR